MPVVYFVLNGIMIVLSFDLELIQYKLVIIQYM
jgi:hypothetical protein